MKKTVSVFLLLSLISCRNEKIKSAAEKNIAETKQYILPNDQFRKEILPQLKHKNDKEKLAALLDSLDKRALSYCDFIKREYEIDDSCYDVARAEYPGPEMQPEFTKLHDDAFDAAHAGFSKQINLTEKQLNDLAIFYAFDKNVRDFCGAF